MSTIQTTRKQHARRFCIHQCCLYGHWIIYECFLSNLYYKYESGFIALTKSRRFSFQIYDINLLAAFSDLKGLARYYLRDMTVALSTDHNAFQTFIKNVIGNIEGIYMYSILGFRLIVIMNKYYWGN